MAEKTDPTWKAPPDATVELTPETFTPTINKENIILVYFYAPWQVCPCKLWHSLETKMYLTLRCSICLYVYPNRCSHCRRMSPEFERAARRLKEYGIPLAKVDATKEKSLAEVHEVKSYPTLLVFRKGRRFTYNGPREETGDAFFGRQCAPNSCHMLCSAILQRIETSMFVSFAAFLACAQKHY